MKNLLICGANGFIGTNCLNYFSKQGKYNITATYFKNEHISKIDGVRYENVDLRNEEEVKCIMHGQDIVIQSAATTTGAKDVIEKPYYHVTDNSVMNSWIFRESVLNNVEHLIFLSCTVMYQPKDVPQKETDWSINDRIYENYFGVGTMKVFMENMCDFYSSIGNTKFTAIRHSNVYGPHDKFDLDRCHVVPAFINKINHATDSLDVWGDGKAKRDILYIDDLVDMIEKIIMKQDSKYELFNCGSGRAYSIEELANFIMNINHKKLKLVFDATKPNIPTTVVLDCGYALEKLGWSAKTHIIDGLGITNDWYRKELMS